jgi:RNA-directed DNA polymerase
VIGVQHIASGRKGPHLDHAGGKGKCEGLIGSVRFNRTDGSSPVVLPFLFTAKVRQLQRKLWATTKQSSDRRFHALYDRIHLGGRRGKRVRENRESAGVDRVILPCMQAVYGVARLLGELRICVQARIVQRRPGAWTSRNQMEGQRPQ